MGLILTQDVFTKRRYNGSAGRHTYGRPTILGNKRSSVTIGNFCSIADGVVFMLDAHHEHKNVSTYPFGNKVMNNYWRAPNTTLREPRAIVVDHDVWIGQNVTIMDGVHIASGAVIGAGSIITREIDPYNVVAGIPARPIQMRFNALQVNALMDIAWWNWPDEQIQIFSDMLCNQDVDRFIDEVRRWSQR